VTTSTTETLHQSDSLFGRSVFHIDLEEVGKLHEFDARIIRDEVVERDGVATFFQSDASGFHKIVDGNGFQDFNHCLARRQERNVILQERFTGTVDESMPAITEDIQAHQDRGIERAARCRIWIVTAEIVRDPVAKEQLVAKHLFVGGKNRLAGYVAVELLRRRTCRCTLGFHGHFNRQSARETLSVSGALTLNSGIKVVVWFGLRIGPVKREILRYAWAFLR
jgi:hypothetical protein